MTKLFKLYRLGRRTAKATAVGLFFGAVLNTHATLNIVSVSPANGATNVCTDTPLRITFDSAPNYGSVLVANSERITIYAQDGTPVDIIDMSLNVNKTGSTNVQPRFVSATNGSANSFFAFPITVSGNTVTIYPHNVAMTNGQTYYINITSQLFTNSANGNFAGINDSTTWSFTTKPAKPPAGTNELVVAADGTGDYCTLQGALDFLPANTGQHILVNVRNGVYEEILWVNNKTNITIRGENRKQTMLRYRNNENLNSGSTKRCLLFVSGDGFAIENLTVTNSTPKGGSQAEALRMAGRRFVANNCDFDSYQDTILVNSSARFAYFYNCLVQGDVDFIWNDASVIFQSCEIKSLTSGGYVCQMRTPDLSHHGAIFLDCNFTKAAGITGCYLNRIASVDGPASEVALVNCLMDTHILAVGWMASGTTNDFRFREYLSTNITGTAAINVSSRANFSSQITETEAKAYRNLTNFYAINLQWLPQLLPNILSHPTNKSAATGGSASFTVSATGIQTANPVTLGDPSIIVPLTYHWFRNGTNIAGATNATLTIPSVLHSDAGTYQVIASNLSGLATSTNVTLTVTGNVAPTVADATVYRHNGQPLNLAVSTLAPFWSDADLDSVSFSSVITPSTNGVDVLYDGVATINYTNANDVADQFSYVISDSLGATNIGLVNVQVTNQPPTAAAVTYFRNSGLPLQIVLSNLATNWSDVEADTLSLVSVDSPTTNGATALYDGVSAINYTNVHSVVDQITYTITDPFGGTVGGVVNVQVIQNPPALIGSTVAGSGSSLTVNFTGTPNVTYWVLASTNVALSLTNWDFISTNVAAPDGTWQLITGDRTNYLRRFYRAVEAY